MAIHRKLYLKLFVIMLLVHKISAAAIAEESTTSDASPADPTNDTPSSPSSVPSSSASSKLDTGHPLIPAASVSADIAKLSPSMSTPQRQSQIIIR